MNPALYKPLALAAAALVLLGAGWWGYQSNYARPRAELDSEIERYRVDLQRKSAELDDAPRQRKKLRELADGMLGDTEERVSVALRTALNEIAADCGLSNPRVDASDPEAVRNPAAKASVVEFARKDLKEQTDFFAVSANFRGVGALQQAMRALAAIQSQPWTRRIDRVEFKPVGNKDRARVEITLKLTTIYMPDVKPLSPIAALWVKPGADLLAAAQPIVAKNVFREPPPAPAVAAAPPPPPPAPAPQAVAPPYADWRITAVVRGVAGPELWVLNDRTKQAVTLSLGQSVLDAVFVGAQGESARLKIGEQEFEVGLAQTLQERRVVSR